MTRDEEIKTNEVVARITLLASKGLKAHSQAEKHMALAWIASACEELGFKLVISPPLDEGIAS